MATITATMRADWGPHLESIARQLAPLLVAAYVAGWWLGHLVHGTNDWLAGKKRPAPAAPDALVLDVRVLRNAGLSYRRIARELAITEWKVRSILTEKK